MNKECKAWIKRNEKALREEYWTYASHPNVDYSEHGPMGFDAWAEREYRLHLEYWAWEAKRERKLAAEELS